MNTAVGGTNGFFPDGVQNAGYNKPWSNDDPKASGTPVIYGCLRGMEMIQLSKLTLFAFGKKFKAYCIWKSFIAHLCK